jgi:hypothetical protein
MRTIGAVLMASVLVAVPAACSGPVDTGADGSPGGQANVVISFGYTTSAIPIQPFAASPAGIAGNWAYGGEPAFYSWATGTAASLPSAPGSDCIPRFVASITDGGVIFGTCLTQAGTRFGIYWPSPTSAPVLIPTGVNRRLRFGSMTVTSGSVDPSTGALQAVGYGSVYVLGVTYAGDYAFRWTSAGGLTLYALPGPGRINASGYAASYQGAATGNPQFLWRPDGTVLQLVNALPVKEILDSEAILTGDFGARVLNLDGSIASDIPDNRLVYPQAMSAGGRVAGGLNQGWTYWEGSFQFLPLPAGSVSGDYLLPVYVDGCGTIVSAVFGPPYNGLGWGKGGAITSKRLCDLIIVVPGAAASSE